MSLYFGLRKPGGFAPPNPSDPAIRASHSKKLLKKYGKSPPETILKLPLETLMSLPVEILNDLPTDKLVLLRDEVLPRLSYRSLLRLADYSPSHLGKLPLDVLNKLPAVALVRLDPALLSELELKKLADVLRHDPRIHERLSDETMFQLNSLPRPEFLSLPPAILARVPGDTPSPAGNLAHLMPSPTPPATTQGKLQPNFLHIDPTHPPAPPPRSSSSRNTAVTTNQTKPDVDPGPINPTLAQSQDPQGPQPSDIGARAAGDSPDQGGTPAHSSPSLIPPITTQTELQPPPSSSLAWIPGGSSNPDPNNDLDQDPKDKAQEARFDALKNEKDRLQSQVELVEVERDELRSQVKWIEDERDRLQDRVVRMEDEREGAITEVTKFLETHGWTETWDQSDNPVKPMFKFASKYVQNSRANWTSAEYWVKEHKKEQTQRISLETIVHELRAQLQHSESEHKIEQTQRISLETTARELRGNLQHSESKYKIEQTQRIGLETTARELRAKLQRSESEHWKTKSQLKDLDDTFQAKLTTRTADLRAKLEEQKRQHSKAKTDQRVSYDKEIKRLQQIIDGQEQKHQVELRSQDLKHADTVRRLNDQHTQEKERQRAAHEAQIWQINEAHEKQLTQARLDLNNVLAKRDQFHQQNVRDLEATVMSLESSLVDNSDDFRPATDDSLKSKYQQLKLAVETITFNLGPVDIPSNSPLDPTRLLETEGRGVTRFLLQSILWGRIKDGFFSAPFGLGALGTGDGKQKLLDLYVAYRSLLEPSQPTASHPTLEAESIALFRTSPEANRFRSAAFQSILVAALPKRGKPSSQHSSHPTLPSASALSTPYHQNRAHLQTTILTLLSDISTNPSGIPDSIVSTVTHLVNTAGELALELGVQRAELGLEMPERGAQVQIGQDFVDCYDGDADRGAVREVVLAVSPRLYKRGDGRGDMKVGKVIFCGEVYAARG